MPFRQVDKLEFVQHISQVPSEEGRNAELALYRKAPEEAESILLQTSPPLVYRAIKLNVSIGPTMPNLSLDGAPLRLTVYERWAYNVGPFFGWSTAQIDSIQASGLQCRTLV